MFAVRTILLSILILTGTSILIADGPADNEEKNVRQVPPPGIEVPSEKQKEPKESLAELEKEILALKSQKNHSTVVQKYLPDVEICHKAVRDALLYSEFYRPAEIEFAAGLLDTGMERASQLKEGNAPWTRQTGLVFRGYRSKIDGSPQPYGLEISANYQFDAKDPWRLDFWFHGRGEKLSEVSFIQQRSTGSGGKIKPKDAIILHPYGRYSNANKFAGEVDLFEALAHCKEDYRIDEDRIFVRGFSMGGAACWQFAVHFPGMWAGAQPGAGFSETPDFLKTFQGETLNPPWWERKLWRWNDATDWALNLTNVPTIAYSGEIDRQKQAADMMVAASEKEGLELVHLIGPDTAHKLHPDSLAEIERRLENISESGRRRVPETIHFVTYTLRYNKMRWLHVDRLTEHWERSEISAEIQNQGTLEISTKGIEAFSLQFEPGDCPFDPTLTPACVLDLQKVTLSKPQSDRSWRVYFSKSSTGEWEAATSPEPRKNLTKRSGSQGPIDDAFTDSFVFVEPSGKPQFDLVGEWTSTEKKHAATHWRKQFRGDARIKKDSAVSENDIATSNLVLWGDPSSNQLIAKIADKLPLHWTSKSIQVGDRTFDTAHHTIAMIYPNPLNPEKYVVLNSGFTYREYDYLNNARQTPKLPDWAIIDLREPVTSRYPGKIVAAGFFDENWTLKNQPED